MLFLATVLFMATVILGLVLFAAVISGKTPHLTTIIMHGMLAEAGFIFVFVQAHATRYKGLLGLDFSLLAVTGVVGLVLLFLFHLKGRDLPRELVAGHAVTGVIALVLLVIRVFRGIV